MLRGIYSAIYGEVNVSVEKCVEIKGDCVENWQSCFVSVTLKKLVRPETFGPYYVSNARGQKQTLFVRHYGTQRMKPQWSRFATTPLHINK